MTMTLADEVKLNGRLVSFGNLTDTIKTYYANKGLVRGLSTGWPVLDEFFLLQKGMLNIVTGIPSSGKSEWLDQLMLNTIAMHEWHWTVFSPESWPLQHHFQKLAEKWTGKPMFPGFPVPAMTVEDIDHAIAELSPALHFIQPPADNVTLDAILGLLKQSKEENDTDAFILDPWNELEHSRPNGMSETEYISQALTKIRNFGRSNNVDMFIVAHPTKMKKDDAGNYPVPDPYDINGSAGWRNKADACISVWRDYNMNDGIVQVHVQKIRNKNLGKLGNVNLFWNKPNGLFFNEQGARWNFEKFGVRSRLC